LVRIPKPENGKDETEHSYELLPFPSGKSKFAFESKLKQGKTTRIPCRSHIPTERKDKKVIIHFYHACIA
jgi:hypothetical protein